MIRGRDELRRFDNWHVYLQPLSPEFGDWMHEWTDVNDFVGREIGVQFALMRKPTSKPLTIWLDEVALGPAPEHLACMPIDLVSR